MIFCRIFVMIKEINMYICSIILTIIINNLIIR